MNFSTRNIDYVGHAPIPSLLRIRDARLIEIFFRRINIRQREFNPMAQRVYPDHFSDSSSEEIRRIDHDELSDVED